MRWLICAALLAVPDPGAAVTIYRFGGASLPPPAEASSPGVLFRQMDWADLDALKGGQSDRTQMDEELIGPLQLNPRTNIAPELLPGDPRLTALVDRDIETFWTAPAYDCGSGRGQSTRCEGRYGQVINIDLEDQVFIDRILIVSGGHADPQFVNPVTVVKHLGIALSSERLGGAGPQPPYILEVSDNKRSTLNLIIPSTEPSNGVQIALAQHPMPYEIVEVQIYAKGVTREASYTSNIIDFERPAVWGEVRWSLREAPNSSVILQTRNGEMAELFRYWQYTGIGDQKLEVTKAEYGQLKRSQQAPPTRNLTGWNPWSARFDLAHEGGSRPPLYPRARRFLQFRLDFDSSWEQGPQLEFLEFRASEAAVQDVVGELDPIEVRAGAPTRFTYALKPRLLQGDTGFDRLEIRAVAARLDSVYSVRIDAFEVRFEVISLGEKEAVVGFPRVDASLSDAIIEVEFGARALRYGSAFAGRIADSRRPFDVSQPVLAGDAVDEMFSDRVWIETTVAVQSVLEAEAVPDVLTPNGDGINDRMLISYNLVEATGGVLIGVEIRDLAGRLVHQVSSEVQQIGRYEQSWDGRDEAGRLVPPGIYLYRVTTDMNVDGSVATGTVRLLY